nr:hypothetical protein [Tanacetum cinerariifolium]
MSVKMLQARENLMKSMQTFLKKFDCISFRERPIALLLAHERFYKLKQAFREEHEAQISTPYWKCPIFYDDDDGYSIQYREYLENLCNAITSDLPTEEPDNSLSMEDEHLSTIPETESDEVIKSSVENLVPIPSESNGISDDTCDVTFCDNSPPFDVLNDHIKLFSNFTMIVLRVKTIILRTLITLMYHLLILSGSTTTHADNSLPGYDSFVFEIEPDQGELNSIVMEDILGEPHIHVPNVLPTHPTLMLDSDFILSDDSIGFDLEVSFPFGTRNKIFDLEILFEVQYKRFLSRDTFSISFIHNLLCPVIKTLLPFSSKNEDKVSSPEIPYGEIKVHIKVLSVLWGNRLPIRTVRCRCLALLLAHERFSKLKKAFREEQHQPENIQELLRKLLNDLKVLNGNLLERGEHAAQISTPYWKCPVFYDDDDEYSIQYRKYLENSSNAITPDLLTEEPDNSLSMGDEHLSTILKTKSDKVIKFSVENLVPIPSESEDIFDDTCDVPFCDNSPPLDVLNDHFDLFSNFNDDCTSSDDDSFEDIDYVKASPPDYELVSLEESHSLFPIPVEDNDSFFDKYNTSLSYSDNSLPEFKTFSDHMKRTSSGSTTTHADNYLHEYDLFVFEIEPDQGELNRVVIEDILGEPHIHVPNVLPTHPTLMLDSDFIASDDSLGSNLEVSFPFGTRNKIFDLGILFEVQSKRFLSRDTFSISFIRNLLCPVIKTLLPFLFENKDKVFNPGILSSNLLSQRGKITFDFSKSSMMIFRGDIPFLDDLFL